MSTPDPHKRIGIAAAGNWIVDKVKTVDVLPANGMLANILGETISTGGAPANVLADLSKLGNSYPLMGLGAVGDDAAGQFILDRFRGLGVDTSQLTVLSQTPTSYTDVMSQQDTGERSFFHFRGANARFGPEHINLDLLPCRILHLGYLMLLDRMDEDDEDYGTVAARFLHTLRQRGIATSIDLVSEDSERFQRIIPPALHYVDYLFMNEIEAARTTGIAVRGKNQALIPDALLEAMSHLSRLGTMRLITVHMPEGAVVLDTRGKLYSIGSLQIPNGDIAGTTGAGDAFCAGMLHGIHERYTILESLRLATCCSAACLLVEDASSGVISLRHVLALREKYACRKPPVECAP